MGDDGWCTMSKRVTKCACAETHAGTRSGLEGLKTPDWSDRQRELRAPIFLPDDHRNQDRSSGGSGGSDVHVLRYGETEFSYEGHQERPELGDTSVNIE